ncbi:hypothetical protein L227DRAFT_394783 [Lentinus tigrinus ALCF2SS1-6]|uniref:superoxide dismutase n=1 Tax=Lentinus tigrinus ALCF2SS1-6 TaxID=1328759 RepID=A0A5C2SQ36_9APHY|nr:hypothetical protein L227DRAFT_394783 [Lentinus tigrinus ALCF2SS1-6]
MSRHRLQLELARLQPEHQQAGDCHRPHVPILGIDIWKHVFYLYYRNVKSDCLTAIWNVINFNETVCRFVKAIKSTRREGARTLRRVENQHGGREPARREGGGEIRGVGSVLREMRIEADVAVATSESLAELQLESSASTSCTRSALRAVCLDRFTTSLSLSYMIMIYTCISPRGHRC